MLDSQLISYIRIYRQTCTKLSALFEFNYKNIIKLYIINIYQIIYYKIYKHIFY